MKEENSEENIEIINYDLSEINKDNDIQFYSLNIEDPKESSKEPSTTKKEKMKLNYSLLIKNIISDINDNRKERYYEGEYKINLLLMSSLKNIDLKLICLNIILRFNNRNEFSSLVNYILTKIYRYHLKQNSNLNKKSLINIMTLSSKILYHQKNYFYSFYFSWNAKKIILKEADNKKYKEELDENNNFLTQVTEMIDNKIKDRFSFFKQSTSKKLEEIKNILDNILRENQIEKKESNDKNNVEKEEKKDIDDNIEYGSYLFLINKDWVVKAKIFIDYYIISTKESLFDEDILKDAFIPNNVLNSYFGNSESDKNTVYPGPIKNYNLLKYNDCWEDPNNEDENYYINKNSKEYFSISEKNYNILKDVFDSTNDIKILEKKFEYFELKVLILDKRFNETVVKKLLRLRKIKARKNMKLTNFEIKISRCIYYEIKKLHKIDSSDYYDYDGNEDDDEINRVIQSSNFSFYLINKENKNILTEICTAYMNKMIYSSCFVHQLSYSGEKDTLNTLLSNYDKSKHYLIIEISDKYSDNFLKEISLNKNSEYSCGLCEKNFKENEKYFCDKCNYSIFCSELCAGTSEDHKNFHKKFYPLLKQEINIKSLRKKILSLDAFSNEGRVGLYNFGNTCYINCVIQSLSNTEDLNKFFVFDFYKNEMNFKYLNFSNDIVENFAEVLKKLWKENEQVAYPKKFIQNFFDINKQFTPGAEQDAHEFLSSLLSNLHESLNQVNKIEINKEKNKEKENITIEQKYNEFIKEELGKNKSYIYNLFTGYYISKTICEQCQKEVVNFESFNTLSLPIPKNHFSFNIKYFTENGVKTFPCPINENSSFIDLKEKALFFYEKDITKKIKKYYGDNIYNILNKTNNNCIYNYNITKIPKRMLLNFIDIIILDKNKSIYDYNMDERLKILQYLKLKDYDYYEIVLYEKNLISDDYINLYIQASCYNSDKRIFFFKSSGIINYSYPLLLTVNKDVALKTLEKILYRKFEIILKSKREIDLENKDKNINLIDIIIPHSKTTSSCPFCHKSFEESEFCNFSDLFEKNNSFLSLLNSNPEINNKDIPILFVANSKYYEVKENYTYNSNILFIEPGKDMKIDKEINLFDCLEKFMEEDILENDNKWFCERCGIKQKSRRKMQIYQTPLYLIIQLKRFKFNNNIIAKFFDRTKNETQVNFPEILDLKEYIYGEGQNNAKYELYSYILHLENHYVSVCKNRGRWILYNDDKLYNFSFKQSRNTYLLFYKKIE